MARVFDSLLDSLLHNFRQAASALPDARRGSNKRYAVADAASCALATFFFQAPSFLNFQRRMQKQSGRSNCHTLFGVQAIPCDNQIRNLLDGLDPDLFAALFPQGLHALRAQGALAPFERLGGRLPIALDGLQIHCSDSIRCEQCCIRHVGKHKTEQYFHTMLSATVVADGHNRVIPLMPEFVQPQQDPAAQRPELTEEQRKQDCERNAAKRWLPAHSDELRPYRPVFLGDDLYCCQPLCELVRDLGADFIFVCKPSSHKRLYELLHDDFIHSSGWIKARNHKQQVELQRYRWMHGVPVRDSDDAVLGSWVEFVIERHGQRTYTNTFCTSLEVTADNVAEIARVGRARWKIENEGFNCLARHGYNSKRNFGHGSQGLANLLATLNLFAFALHEIQDCACELGRRCRQRAGPRREFFEQLRFLTQWFCFRCWTALFETLLEEDPPTANPRAAAPAPS